MVPPSSVEAVAERSVDMQSARIGSSETGTGNATSSGRQDSRGSVAFHRGCVRQIIDLHGTKDLEKLQSLFNITRRSIVIGFEIRFGYNRPHMHRRWITRILERVEVEELGLTN